MAFYVYASLLLFTVCHAVLGAHELSITPAVDRLFVNDNERVTLVCSFKAGNNSAGESLTVRWRLPHQPIGQDEGNPVSKEIEQFSDTEHAGVYTCELFNKKKDEVEKSKNITLTGITESKTTPELKYSAEKNLILTQNLICNITLSQASLKVSGPKWFQNKTSVEDLDTRFKEHEDENMLEIITPQTTDIGVYYAEYEISDDQKTYVHKCNVDITAKPNVDHRPAGCKNVIEGKKIDLQCMVWGYPRPTITWYKDGKVVNVTEGSSKVTMNPVNGYKDAHLVIDDADFPDSGKYKCVAFTKYLNATATQDMCVGVKDKHAALWPFLAIVCEVLVLCAIIFVYEKRRNDKAKAAEREAQDTPTTEVKGKVRNRRQQSS